MDTVLGVASQPVFLAHPSSLAHDTGPHPERAERIVAIERELERRGWLGWRALESPAVARSTLTAVHPEEYVASIEAAAASGGGQLDLDTVISEGSFEAALSGAACGGRGGADGRLAAGRGGIGGVQLAPAPWSSRPAVPGDGVLPVQQHRRGRSARAR